MLDQTVKWTDVGGTMEQNWEGIIKARLAKFGEAILPIKSGFNPIGIEEEEVKRLAETYPWRITFNSACYAGGVVLPLVTFYPMEKEERT